MVWTLPFTRDTTHRPAGRSRRRGVCPKARWRACARILFLDLPLSRLAHAAVPRAHLPLRFTPLRHRLDLRTARTGEDSYRGAHWRGMRARANRSQVVLESLATATPSTWRRWWRASIKTVPRRHGARDRGRRRKRARSTWPRCARSRVSRSSRGSPTRALPRTSTAVCRAADQSADVVVLNSDMEARPGWLACLQYAGLPRGRCRRSSGPALLYPDGRIQFAGTAAQPGRAGVVRPPLPLQAG